METGQKIREYRTSKGMTQEELADAVKTNVRTIQRIENGQVKARVFTLKAIAQALHIDYVSLTETVACAAMPAERVSSGTLAWLHLSGILLLPTVAVWRFEKNEEAIQQHSRDVINFQLTMLSILVPCLVFPSVLLVLAAYTVAVLVVNAITVGAGGNYYYPFSIGFVGKAVGDV